VISEHVKQAVRDRTDIVALVGENVRLKKQGRNLVGLCPFHKERTPSFSVNQERGVFYCHGCKESGDVFSYLMKLEGHAFPEALRILAERCGVEIEEGTDAEQLESQQRRQRQQRLHDLMQLAASFFERELERHPLSSLARAELHRRG
jgi:DNA primase